MGCVCEFYGGLRSSDGRILDPPVHGRAEGLGIAHAGENKKHRNTIVPAPLGIEPNMN